MTGSTYSQTCLASLSTVTYLANQSLSAVKSPSMIIQDYIYTPESKEVTLTQNESITVHIWELDIPHSPYDGIYNQSTGC